MTIIIQAVEAGGRSGGRNFPAIEFAGKKSPDLAFSNVDRYVVTSLDRMLYDDYRCLLASKKQQIHWTRTRRNPRNIGSLETPKQVRIPPVTK